MKAIGEFIRCHVKIWNYQTCCLSCTGKQTKQNKATNKTTKKDLYKKTKKMMWVSWMVPKLSRGAVDLPPTLDNSSRGLLQARSGLVPWTEWPFVGNNTLGDFSGHILRFSLIQSEFGPHALVALRPNSKPKLSKGAICFPSNDLSWLKLDCCHNQTLFPLHTAHWKKKNNLVIWINFLLNYHS